MSHSPHRALGFANARRSRIAEIKRQFRSGELDLCEVIITPPADLALVALVDVVRWAREARGDAVWFTRMGRAAVRDGVNLTLPLGQASQRTRLWVADYARWHMKPRLRAAA